MAVGAGSDALARAARLVQIISLIFGNGTSERRIGRQDMADACGCDIRTVGRDLDLLREIAPIHWDPAKRSYVLTDRRWRFPVEPLTAEDVLSLTLARGLLSAPGVPQRAAMRRTFERVLRGLPPALNALSAEAGEAIAFPNLPRDYSDAPIAELTRAVTERRAVEIDYESRSGDGRRGWRRLEPYLLAPRDGVYWELYGWCPRNAAVRTFALDRIHGVRLLDERFTRRDAEWALFLDARAASVGAIIGSADPGAASPPAFPVDVRFDAQVAAYVRERRWSSTLVVDEAVDGAVRLHGTTANCDALAVELLRWRRFARVAGGEELRAAYRDELRAMGAVNGLVVGTTPE